MDIIIKSFNRPYYLDRCIKSIYQFVTDNDFKIIVLDDGTPSKYLDKIQEKYPNILIIKSDNYADKVNFIEGKSSKIPSNIPIDLWLKTAQQSSDFFLLLEDDIWFINQINLEEYKLLMATENVQMLKLFWLSNPNLIMSDNMKSNHYFSYSKPQIYTNNTFLYQAIFQFYKYKSRKILTSLGVYNNQRALAYYTIYAVAGAIFNKKYFVELWKNHQNSIDESLQIKNAIKYVNKNQEANFGHIHSEILKTSFQTAATNSHKNYKSIKIDMFAFNKLINQVWYHDAFDSMNNFPEDINAQLFESILDKNSNELAQKKEWVKWVTHFKNTYKNFGCAIE